MLKKIFEIRNKILAVLYEKKYHPIRVKFYKTLISPGDLVFDIGANVGNRVKVFLEIGAKVIAVEPQPDCISILKNKFGNSIIIEPVCLGGSVYETEMFISNESTLSTLNKDFIEKAGKTIFTRNTWEKKIKVDVETLDNLIKKYGKPQFCKIDVEGFEQEVLKGLTHTIPYISFEYCIPEMSDNLVNSLKEINRISPNGKFNYCINEMMELALPNWIDFKEMINLVSTNDFIKTQFGDIYFKS